MWVITDNPWPRTLIWNVIVITYKQSPLAFLTMLLNLAIFGWLYADVWVLCCGIPIGIIFAFNTFVYVRIKRKIWLTGVLLSSFNALILALWTFNVYSNHGASIPLTISSIILSSFIPLTVFVIGWCFFDSLKVLISAFPLIHFLMAVFLLWLKYPLLYFSFSCSANIIIITFLLYFFSDKVDDAELIFTKKETLLIYLFTLIVFLVFELPALSKLEILHNYGVLDKIEESLAEDDKAQSNEPASDPELVLNGPHPWMKYVAPHLPKSITTNPSVMVCVGQECSSMYANGLRQSLWTRGITQFTSSRTTKSTLELEQIEKEPSQLKKIKRGVKVENVEKELTKPSHYCDVKAGSSSATAFVLTTKGNSPLSSSTIMLLNAQQQIRVPTCFVSEETVQPTTYKNSGQYMVRAVYHMPNELIDKFFVDPEHMDHADMYYTKNQKIINDIRAKIMKKSCNKEGELVQINQITEKN